MSSQHDGSSIPAVVHFLAYVNKLPGKVLVDSLYGIPPCGLPVDSLWTPSLWSLYGLLVDSLTGTWFSLKESLWSPCGVHTPEGHDRDTMRTGQGLKIGGLVMTPC